MHIMHKIVHGDGGFDHGTWFKKACESGRATISAADPVLWIRIRMDPEFLPGSGSGIIVLDPDPAESERACK